MLIEWMLFIEIYYANKVVDHLVRMKFANCTAG